MPKYFLLYFCLRLGFLFSQVNPAYIWPLDVSPVLTANYGQIRANHFHAGIDLSTNGKENLTVHAIESGYVSRIKVSAYGYGKAIYITHSIGKVSVYAHLNAYCAKIDTFIKKEQYKIESYEIDCYPSAKIFIKKGEVVALSGNTGASTGPHLHFEIRDELSEIPLNPLNFYKISDHIKPNLQAIALFDLSDTLNPKFLKSIKISLSKSGLVAQQNSITINQSILGFAFSGYDKNDGNSHFNNIYSSKLYLDGKEIYTHLLQAVSFDESRYVNEYAEASKGLVYQKCFLPVLAPADFVMNSSKQTRISFKDTNYHHLKLIVADESGNQNEVQVYVKSKKITNYHSFISQYDLILDCRKSLYFSKGNLSLFCPPYTFFMSSPLTVKNNLESSGKLVMLPSDLNLKSAMQLRFKIPANYQSNKQKIILKNNGNIYVPSFHADSVSFFVKNLGWFQVDFDSVAPSISLLNMQKKKAPNNTKRIAFTIKDGSSGIATYKLYLNKKFYLAEFDAKNNLLSYAFDQKSPLGLIDVQLDVFDKAGNKASKSLQIKR
ncbi:MAG: M23 family metallopeptidase [Bacteroidota bacterium]